MQCGGDQQAFTVRTEAGDERTVHDLPVKERSFERHHDEVPPSLLKPVAHPNNCLTSFSIESGRGTNDEIVVGPPREHIAGIPSFRDDRTGFEIDPVHFESRSITQVRGDENCSGMSRVGQNILRAHAAERGEITHVATR